MRIKSKYIVFLFFTITIAFTSCKDSSENKIKIESDELDNIHLNDSILPGYSISMELENTSTNKYILHTSLQLDKGYYITSPFSKDSVLGKISITLDSNSSIQMSKIFAESPESKLEYDPNLKDHFRFNRGTTEYKQGINVINNGSFEVQGKIWFVLEPRCTPEEIKFIILNENDSLKINLINSL